jgi:hypothetical protein
VRGPAGSRTPPKVILHVGEPKTGTTFVQQVLWRNRAQLAAQGVVLPGHHPQDHFRAAQDVRGIARVDNDPAADWAGDWDILARQAQQAPRVAVISHELLCAAEPEQADRAVQSLHPAEVHLVLSVRDVATLLPAEWQETVKHRNERGWEDWLQHVIDRESDALDRRKWMYWKVHSTMEILAMWSRRLPPEQVHVIMMPPHGSPSGLLWERFAGLLEIDPGSVDITRARPNSSLGMAETEFLRRLNKALPDEIPNWFYMRNIKEPIAHGTLAARPRGPRLVLPPDRGNWVRAQADALIKDLTESGYDLIGDVSELLPPVITDPALSPGDQPAELMLDAAVDAAAALVVHQFHRAQPAAKPQPDRGPRGLVGRVESTVAASPRLKRTLRELSRFRAMRVMRIAAWRAMNWTQARRQS